MPDSYPHLPFSTWELAVLDQALAMYVKEWKNTFSPEATATYVPAWTIRGGIGHVQGNHEHRQRCVSGR